MRNISFLWSPSLNIYSYLYKSLHILCKLLMIVLKYNIIKKIAIIMNFISNNIKVFFFYFDSFVKISLTKMLE